MEIKNFKELNGSSINLIGGKGLSLVKMTSANFNVPEGFVIPVGLELTDENINLVMNAFDDLGSELVAVRSSATVEDGAKNSWAGQFSSYLNVTKGELIDQIKLVQDSVENIRANVYSEKTDSKELNMAVVVQKMINPVASGIAFSINPINKNTASIVIEAGLGLGEPIVSGMITPDNYEVNKETLEINKVINIQITALYKDGYKDLKEEEYF